MEHDRRRFLFASCGLPLGAHALPPGLDFDHPQALRGLGHGLPPLSFLKGAEPSGLFVDLLRLLAKRLELPLELDIHPLRRMLQPEGLGPGVVLFPVARVSERERYMEWVGPVLPRRVRIYRLTSRADLQFPGLDQLGRQQLVVNRGTATHLKLTEDGRVGPHQIQLASGYPSALQMLRARRAEYLLMNEIAMLATLQQLELPPDTLTVVGELEDAGSYWFALAKRSTVLAQRLQQGYDALKSEGQVEALKRAYGLL